jgi:hypothetical protein
VAVPLVLPVAVELLDVLMAEVAVLFKRVLILAALVLLVL